MEHYQKFAKLAVATVGTALSFAAVMKVNPASAADFTFSQGGYASNGVFSGTFSGNPDLNGTIAAPTAFSASFSDSTGVYNSSYSLSDLSSFNYNPTATPGTRVLSLVATDPSSFKVSIPFATGNDGFVQKLNGPGTYTSSNAVVSSVPEPTNVMGVVLVGLGGLGGLLKKKVVSSQKAYL